MKYFLLSRTITEKGIRQKKPMDFEEWVLTKQAENSFEYDTNSAMESDLVIYIGPSGKDAAAELGMAYAKRVPIVGLYAKGEDFGLMRKMMTGWYERYTEVLDSVDDYEKCLNWQNKEPKAELCDATKMPKAPTAD